MKSSIRRATGIVATAVLAGLSACKEVSVTAAEVFSVEVDPASAQLVVGQKMGLTAHVQDSQGHQLIRNVTWSSDATAIASVSSDGQVTAQAPGTAHITASVDGHTGSATIGVDQKPVASVDVQPPARSITVGDSAQFTATAKAGDGSVVGGKVVVWTSSDPGVVSVRQDGWVHALALAAGPIVIRATVDGVNGQATVSVTAALLTVASVEVQPPSANLGVGDTLRLQFVAKAANGTVIPGRQATWTTDNSAVATVDGGGKVRAAGVGSANIRATVDGISGLAAISVAAATIASVEISPQSSTVAVSNTIPLQAIVHASDGSIVQTHITWTSAQPNIASVDTAGLVTARSVGTATITAAAGGKTGNATVFVVQQPISSVAITPANPSLFVADTLLLSAVLKDANGVTLNNRVVTWQSTDTSVAVVVSTGPTTQQARLIGRRTGSAGISASAEARSDQTTAKVDARAELVVTKTASAPLVKAGDTINFTLQTRNQGPSSAAAVVVTDTLPANAAFVSATGGALRSGNVLTWPAVASLASGSSLSFTIRVVAPGSGAVTNVGAAVTATFERNRADNRAASTVNISPADLVVKKSANAGVVNAGDMVVFTIDVSNAGTSAAGSVVVTDTLPTNAAFVDATGGPVLAGNVLTWPTIASLGAGGSVSFTVRVLAPASGSITNVAAAVAPAGDANPADNRSAVTVGVNALADLLVSKTASAGAVNAGDPIVYTIRVRNLGPSAAAAVSVRDSLPANAAFVSASPSASLSGTVLTWPTVGTLAAGDSLSYSVTVTLPANGTVRNVALASSTTAEASTANNVAAVSTSVNSADLAVTKTGPATAAPGDNILLVHPGAEQGTGPRCERRGQRHAAGQQLHLRECRRAHPRRPGHHVAHAGQPEQWCHHQLHGSGDRDDSGHTHECGSGGGGHIRSRCDQQRQLRQHAGRAGGSRSDQERAGVGQCRRHDHLDH